MARDARPRALDPFLHRLRAATCRSGSSTASSRATTPAGGASLRCSCRFAHIDGFVQRAEQEWPLARTRWTRLYLDPGAERAARPSRPGDAQASFRAAGGRHHCSAPRRLSAETEITGPVAAKLFVSSSTSDADLFVVVRLFVPAARSALRRRGRPQGSDSAGMASGIPPGVGPGAAPGRIAPTIRTTESNHWSPGAVYETRRRDLADRHRDPGRLHACGQRTRHGLRTSC